MSWAKFDDRYDDNPKVRAAWSRDRASVGLHVMAITYCCKHETDGRLPFGWVVDIMGSRARATKIVDLLCEVGLFERDAHPDWLAVHDFLEFNPSKAAAETKRAWDRARKELYSDHALIAAIRDRDRDVCRYCGTEVNWRDRRGPTGGTYDHVIPRGPNSLENVVVACRHCNNVKGARTPEQAAMPLLPAIWSGTKNGTGEELDPDLGSGSDPLAGAGPGARAHPRPPSRPVPTREVQT